MEQDHSLTLAAGDSLVNWSLVNYGISQFVDWSSSQIVRTT
jgi:hypothetical protein